MFERISKKDIITINKLYDEGNIINNSSLEFALAEANKSKSWLRSCSVLVRAVLIDHVFEEGNKRTAAAIITGFFADNNVLYDPDKVSGGITKILMKNMTNLVNIERVILDAIIR